MQSRGPILVAYGVAILQVSWHLNACFTIISVYYVRYSKPSDNCTNDPNGMSRSCSGDGGSAWSGFAFWYTVFSFYWTAQVIRNIAHFTTAGTVSSWWLVSEIQSPTWGSFKRATTTSLGTIAVGSIFVTIVEILSGFARSYGGCVCQCLCYAVRRAVKWFNRYAFIISAMYGSTFFAAAQHVTSLMSARFWELLGHTTPHPTYSRALTRSSRASSTHIPFLCFVRCAIPVNDSLTSSVFWMGSFLGGVVAGIVGGIWTYSALSQSTGVIYLLVLLCFIIGCNIASLFMAVIDSAVATTLVVWAEDPQSMHRNRPELHDKIALAAQQAYPTVRTQHTPTTTHGSHSATRHTSRHSLTPHRAVWCLNGTGVCNGFRAGPT